MTVFGLLSLQVLVARQFARVCHSVNMERSVKENHVAVIALHNCRKSDSQIFELLKPLKISRMFLYRTIKRYEELWRVEDRAQSGRLKSLRVQDDIKTVRQRIRRNPLWKQKIISRELSIPTQSMLRLIRDDQHMRLHCHLKGHILTPLLNTMRRTRTERLLHWQTENGHENILFTDEKNLHHRGAIQPPEQKIYDQSSREAKENVPRVQGGHKLSTS